jgi:glycerophosphoryl diester phosphodiesterase
MRGTVMKDRNIILEELKKYRFAHRGLHDKPEVPENSLLAFERACERGFGIEFDVHLTKNGKLAVMHDSGLKRVTTVRSDHLPVIPENAHIECTTTFRTAMIIEEITLEEAKKYPLEESDERIPELKEVLDLVAGRVPVIVELKPRDGNHEELVKKVMEEMRAYEEKYPEGVFCLESFNSFAVLTLKRKYPEVVRGQLGSDLIADYKARVPGDPREGTKFDPMINSLVRDLRMNRLTDPDFVAYNYDHKRNRAFREFPGTKVFYTIKDPIDLAVGEGLGAICIFERFVPESNLRGGKI